MKAQRTPDQKTVTVGSKSVDALWASMAARHREETPPPGSMSARDYAEKFKVPLKDARSRLAQFADEGAVTGKLYRTRVGNRVCDVMFYTPKQAA